MRLRDCVDRLGKHGKVMNGTRGKCCEGIVVLDEQNETRAILPAVKTPKMHCSSSSSPPSIQAILQSLTRYGLRRHSFWSGE